ncbi:hypothetical protein GGF31_005505 [Allomyces arbusculus]|nr:hypothetical protein GGF31_005505 [Allomyces arbusculus]
MASANIDRKRINGPEVSVIPLPLEGEASAEQAPLLNQDAKRQDGRNVETVRPFFIKTGAVPAADGSAFVEQGNTKVICAVYGPRPDRKLTDTDRGRMTVEFRLAPFAQAKRRGFVKDVVEKEYSQVLEDALAPAIVFESFSKAAVDVFVTVLEDDGTLAAVAAGVSAASLALADAGIEMYDLVAACTAGFVDDMVVMDLTATEEKLRKGSMLLAYMSSLNQVSQVIQTGSVGATTAEEAMDFCIDACAEIHTLMSEALVAAAHEAQSHTAPTNNVAVVDDDDDMEL